MPIFAFLGFLIFLMLVVVLAVGISSRMQRATLGASFARGRLPELKEGFYSGKSYLLFGLRLPWLGLRFDGQPLQGSLTVFKFSASPYLHILTPGYKGFLDLAHGRYGAYPFRLSQAPAIGKNDLSVLLLDYNIAENPGLVRMLRAELVEIDPGSFLGRLYVEVVPGHLWCLGYYELREAFEANEETAQLSAPAVEPPTPPILPGSGDKPAPSNPPIQSAVV